MKKKLLLLTMFVCVMVQTRADVEINTVNFPDSEFRSWILSQSYGSDGVLTDDEIQGIKEIIISDCFIQDMKGIEYFTALKKLDCSYNQLTTLDVSKNTALQILNCYRNSLTSLDVSQNTALMTLQCFGNSLSSLDVSQNTALIVLNIYSNSLTSLDVSQNTALRTLLCYKNQLTSLDVTGCKALTRLDCYKNQLTYLNFTGCTLLTLLNCYDNQLTSLDVTGCTALETLDCYQNQINGDAMESLVASMPTMANGTIRVSYISYDVYERNTMTRAQAEALKNKGWTTLCYDGYVWEEYNISKYKRGDANEDGEIDMSDVSSVVNSILGSQAETFNVENADANRDGKIGMSDVMFTVNYILNGRYPSQDFYLGTIHPTKEKYTSLPGVITYYPSLEDAIGTTVSAKAGESVYMMCPDRWIYWMDGTELRLENEKGEYVASFGGYDYSAVPGYAVSTALNASDSEVLVLKKEPAPDMARAHSILTWAKDDVIGLKGESKVVRDPDKYFSVTFNEESAANAGYVNGGKYWCQTPDNKAYSSPYRVQVKSRNSLEFQVPESGRMYLYANGLPTTYELYKYLGADGNGTELWQVIQKITVKKDDKTPIKDEGGSDRNCYKYTKLTLSGGVDGRYKLAPTASASCYYYGFVFVPF